MYDILALKAKELTLNELDCEILSLHELTDVVSEISRSQDILSKMIEYKGKVKSILPSSRSVLIEIVMDMSKVEFISTTQVSKTPKRPRPHIH